MKEQIDKKEARRRTRQAIVLLALIYGLGNTPQFMETASTPRNKLRNTLQEQLVYERSQLRDISRGAVWANFRIAGISAGYLVRKYILK